METNANHKSKEVTRLVGTLVVLFAIIGIFLLYTAWPTLTGTSVVLKTRPIDPFDPLRGQYMVITYDISQVPGAGLSQGDTVYTVIVPADGLWVFESVNKQKPLSGVFLKGRVISSWGESARVEYGIEQYFFEQNAVVPTQGVTVEVKVANNGKASVVELLQDGKPVDIKYQPVTLTS